MFTCLVLCVGKELRDKIIERLDFCEFSVLVVDSEFVNGGLVEVCKARIMEARQRVVRA